MSPGAWVCRGLMAGLPAVAAACTTGAGESAPAWFFFVVVLLGVGWAAFPESAAGAVVMVLVIAWWGIGLREGIDPWAFPAAAGLLAAHVAAVLVSYGPADLAIDGPTAWLWARRGALACLLVPVTYGLAVWVRDEPAPGGMWAAGLAAAFAALLAASLTLSVLAEPEEP